MHFKGQKLFIQNFGMGDACDGLKQDGNFVLCKAPLTGMCKT